MNRKLNNKIEARAELEDRKNQDKRKKMCRSTGGKEFIK